MLDRLDDVDWASLNHAYGSAEDVPAMLRALACDDAVAREDALYEAYGNIFHQGTRYEATAHAVPFLLEILKQPECVDQAELMHLLTHLVMGYSEAYVPFGFAPEIEGMRAELKELSARPDTERVSDEADEEWGTDEQWLTWMVAITDEVRKGVAWYVRFLTADDEAVRLAALYLLSFLPEDFETFGPAVWELANSDDSDTVRANALVTLALASTPAQFEEFVDEMENMLADGEPIVRFTAALALGTRVLDVPDAVIQVLLDAVGRAGGEDAEEDEDPADDWEFLWCEGDYGMHAGTVLSVLCHDEPHRVVNAVSRALPGMATIPAHSAAGVVLQLIFPDGYDSEDCNELTKLQRQFLGTLAEHRNPWYLDDAQFGNMSLMMSDFGLPGSMDELQAFLR